MKWILFKSFLFLVSYYHISKFCHEKTDGFALTKIHSNLPYQKRWDVSYSELPDVFQQKYFYLSSGGQAYAFISEDRKIVLKFFKHHLRRIPIWLKILPLPSFLAQKREKQKKKRENKLIRDFQSYLLAFQMLKEEAGLLYLHLNSSNFLGQKARIIDKLGIEHQVDLDKVSFLIQKKAEVALPYFRKLLKENEKEKVKQGIESLCQLILSRCQKGVHDEDPRIHCNAGFVDGKAMFIDVGRMKKDLSRKEPHVQKEDLAQITKKLYEYFKLKSPELAEYLEKQRNV